MNDGDVVLTLPRCEFKGVAVPNEGRDLIFGWPLADDELVKKCQRWWVNSVARSRQVYRSCDCGSTAYHFYLCKERLTYR